MRYLKSKLEVDEETRFAIPRKTNATAGARLDKLKIRNDLHLKENASQEFRFGGTFVGELDEDEAGESRAQCESSKQTDKVNFEG